jgi:hypothetical protein
MSHHHYTIIIFTIIKTTKTIIKRFYNNILFHKVICLNFYFIIFVTEHSVDYDVKRKRIFFRKFFLSLTIEAKTNTKIISNDIHSLINVNLINNKIQMFV